MAEAIVATIRKEKLFNFCMVREGKHIGVMYSKGHKMSFVGE
jgi:hypothetical protein